ncbi:MAG: ABC transporter ATP-binding protein [Rhizobiaceae bacterium]|nr:ABC transporter ATP-binding protein [Rhizobiaceae bacterium]
MSSIELTGLTKSYAGVAAVHPLDFHIEQGEFLSILGPSGSGKTTLLRMIAGFVQPDAGSIRIGSREVLRLPPQRRNLGVVFQNYALFQHMSVIDNVAFGLRMRGQPKKERHARAAQALDLVGLSGMEQRLPNQLSGGQQQRVALARAIVFEPEVLLLDEPLGALDLKLRKRMQIELKHLHRRLQRTFVYITHDQEEALTMSDRVAVMDRGYMLQIDVPANLYLQPRSAFVAEFLGESNLLAGALVRDAAGALAFAIAGGPAIVLEEAQASGNHPVVLAVRPERLRLAGPAESGGDWIVLDAVVDALSFKGAWLSLVANRPEGQLEVLLPNDGRDLGGLPSPGEPVKVAFRASDARLVEARK